MIRLEIVLAALSTILLWSGPTYGGELIYRQDWTRITSATSVLQLPALARVVREFEADEDVVIVIQYPGGDDGNQWAFELRDWLVALGIGSSKIKLRPGSGAPDAIMIKTEPQGLL